MKEKNIDIITIINNKNKIGIFFCIAIIVFTQFVSAETIYAGDNFTISSEFEIVNCSIIGNTYNLEGLNLSWTKKEILISTVINFKPDNLSVSCSVIKYKEEKEIVEPVWYSFGPGGSSSSKTKVIPENKTEETKEEVVATEEPETKEVIEKTISIWYFIVVLLILLIIGIVIYKLIKKNGEEEVQEDFNPYNSS